MAGLSSWSRTNSGSDSRPKTNSHTNSKKGSNSNSNSDYGEVVFGMAHVSSGRKGFHTKTPDFFMMDNSNSFSSNSSANSSTYRTVHTGIVCDACRCNPIEGVRYKCLHCPNYNLCSRCMDSREMGQTARIHSGAKSDHLFVRQSKSDFHYAHLPSCVSSARNDQLPPILADRSEWVHQPNIHCDSCDVAPIVGFRYMCVSCCTSFCEACESLNIDASRTKVQ